MLDRPHYVLVSEGSLCLCYCSMWVPFLPCCQGGSSTMYQRIPGLKDCQLKLWSPPGLIIGHKRWDRRPNWKHLNFNFSRRLVVVESTDCISGLKLFQLFSIFEGWVVPVSKAFDRFLQDHWYWLPSDSKFLIGELAFDNGDAGGCAGFDLHSQTVNVFLEFMRQAFSACLCLSFHCHVIHICPDWGENAARFPSVCLQLPTMMLES